MGTRTIRAALAGLTAALLATVVLVLPGQPALATSCATNPRVVTPAAPVGLVETEVRWTRVTKRTTYGEDVVLEGQVVSDGRALGDEQVELWAQPAGSQWQRESSTTSDPKTGVFSFGCVVADTNTRYRVVYPGSGLYAASEATRRVRVARDLTEEVRQTGPTTFVHRGTVNPRHRGQVLLQHRAGDGPWRVTARSTGSRWSFRIDVARLRGEHAYRVMVPGDPRYVASRGGTWRVTVR